MLFRISTIFLALSVMSSSVTAQATGQATGQPGNPAAERRAAQALATPEEPAVVGDVASSAIPILELLTKGGWLMVPIVLMSLVVVAVAVERVLGLRRVRVAPRALLRRLRQLGEGGAFEPQTALAACARYPSAAARIVTTTIAKLGRPHAEVEATAAEAINREADRMYANVRTLNLAAAVTPLMGLLGTVWGMIGAFFATATLPIGSNKGQALAEGIYVALVTTFAGLAVAIPAAVLAHFLESRILRLLRSVEQLLAEILPHMEKYEGTSRSAHGLRAADPTVVATAKHNTVDWPHELPAAPHVSQQPAPASESQPWQGS